MFLKKVVSALLAGFLVFTSTPALQADVSAESVPNVFYAVDNLGAIWEVDPVAGSSVKVNETGLAGLNSAAYDNVRDQLFFMSGTGANTLLYYWNKSTTGPASVVPVANFSQLGSPTVAPNNAAFHNGSYWFISDRTLTRITFTYGLDGSPTGPVRSSFDLASYTVPVFPGGTFGDIVITPAGMLYGSSRPSGLFFSLDLNLLGSTGNIVYKEIGSVPPGFQLSFNNDFSLLYAVNSNTSELGTVNLGTGAFTVVGSVNTGGSEVTDLAGASSVRKAAACTMNNAAATNNQQARVGTAVANAPAVTVVDSMGVPVPGVDVTFAVASGGGTVGGGASAVVKTDLIGVATAPSWVLGSVVGSNTLTASSGVLCSLLFQATGTQPGISLSKALTGAAPTKAGDPVTWNLVATNTGTVQLTGVTIVDDLTGDTKVCGTLVPTAVCSLSVTYPATQANINAGVINNTARVSGVAPEGDTFSATANAQTSIVASPAITLSKVSDVPAVPVAGNTVVYDFVATNTGNVTLSNVSISDPLPGLGALTCSPAQPAVLNPGQILSCRANYTLTQANIDSGKINNTASVSGVSPGGGAPVAATASKETVLGQNPGMSFVKTAIFSDPPKVGDIVDYEFEVVNTGNVTLLKTTVVDALEGISELECAPAMPATLPPGEDLFCVATYAVTQPDIDFSAIVNTATVTAETQLGAPLVLEAEVEIDIPQNPAITLEKTVKILESPTLGQPIVYELVATNTGDVTLNNVLITDPLPGATVPLCDQPQPAVLEVGQQLVCETTYLITSQDIFNGVVKNTAEVIGNSPFGVPVGGEDSTETVIPNSPAFMLTKQVKSVDDTNGSGATDPGDLVTWTITLKNEGDVPLQRVSIYDDLVDQTVECGVLKPQESCVAELFYTVRQIDGKNGAIINNATGTAYDQIGTELTATVQNVVPVVNPAPPIVPASLVDVPPVAPAATGDAPPPSILPQTGGAPLHLLITGALLLLVGSLLAVRNKRNEPLFPPPVPTP